MDGTLKISSTARPRQTERIFLFPGALEAEPWGVWFANGKSRCAQVCASPQQNPWRKKSTLIFPIRQVFCLPLWLNETNPARLAEMIDLQLETRGWAGNAASWSIVAQEANRTLVLAGLLAGGVPTDLQPQGYQDFDVSARYLPWPENALTLWREQGRLAAAFSRGENLVYFQDLGEERCSERTLQSLVCLRASLEIQSVLVQLDRIVVWTELTPVELAALEKTLRLPVQQVEGPPPVPPATAWHLCPPEVIRFRRESDARRWKGRVLLFALAAYLLFAALLIGQFLFTAHRLTGLRQWQGIHAGALAEIARARADWQRLQPVVDTADYPLEILLHTAAAIPQDHLHLTRFEVDGAKTSLQGEATDIAAAYSFFDRLKADLPAYDWKMGEPHLLPNDLAQFQIEGTHAAVNP